MNAGHRKGAVAGRCVVVGKQVTDVDLDDPGERALVDARQDMRQADWWIWRKRPAPVERLTPDVLINTAVERMVFDPGADAPISGIGVIVGYDSDAETWADTSLSLEEARKAVSWW